MSRKHFLADLLEHPEIKPTTMISWFAGREIKHRNMDLGRVLAITILADRDDYRRGVEFWKDALTADGERLPGDAVEKLERSARS